MKTHSILVLLICSLFTTTANASQSDDEWQFTATPYLWLPTIAGDLAFDVPPGGGGAPTFDVGPTDWLDLLNFALLLSGSAKKGQFSVYTDFVYLSLTGDNDGEARSIERNIGGDRVPVTGKLTLDSQTDLDGVVWMLAGGYEFSGTEHSSHNIYAGFRVFHVEVETDWKLSASIEGPRGETLLPAKGGAKRDTELWDSIVGVRGHFGLGEGKWSLPYAVDIGKGESDFTWNAMAGISRKFDWGDIVFVYRHLEYDEGSDGLLQEFSFSGPVMGATFHF